MGYKSQSVTLKINRKNVSCAPRRVNNFTNASYLILSAAGTFLLCVLYKAGAVGAAMISVCDHRSVEHIMYEKSGLCALVTRVHVELRPERNIRS